MLPGAHCELERLCPDTFHFLLILLLPGCEGGAEDERDFLPLPGEGWADPGWRRLCPEEPGRRKSCFLSSHPRGGREGGVGSQLIVAVVTVCFLNMKISTLNIPELRERRELKKRFLQILGKGAALVQESRMTLPPMKPRTQAPWCLALP